MKSFPTPHAISFHGFLSRRLIASALVIALMSIFSGFLYAQQSSGVIHGRIRGLSDFDRLRLHLLQMNSGDLVMETKPESDGTFVLRDVPYTGYLLRLMLDSTVLAQKSVMVHSAVPLAVTFDSVRVSRSPEVIVEVPRYQQDRYHPESHTFYTATDIRDLPVMTPEKGIEAILLSTPGVVPDEDGRIHVRGEEAQLQYVIDGIPVTANLTRVYSSLFSASLIKSVDLQTGGLNAEYGRSAAAVLAITTRSGFDHPFFATARASTGSFGTQEVGAEIGGTIGGRGALYLAGSTSRSDRYLDPIALGGPNHDYGEAGHFFGKGNLVITNRIDLSVLGSYNKTMYEVPNGQVRALAQDQRQNLSDYMVGARLNADLNEDMRLSAVGYMRHARAAFTSGGLMRIASATDSTKAVQENEKLFIGAERVNDVKGGQLELSMRTSWFQAGNDVKVGAGMESYPLSEFFTFAVTNPALSDPGTAGGDIRYLPYDLTKGGHPFLVDRSLDGTSFFAFVQDQIAFDRWVFNVGLRYDHFNLLGSDDAISPRLGATYQWNDNLVLRGSYSRIVMQAPVENILVSSSDQARQLTAQEQGDVPTQVTSEGSHNIELGADYRLNDFLHLSATGYGKLIDNFIVKVELGNSGIIFPVNLKQGVVAGGEMRAELRDWNNLSGFLAVSGGVALGVKPEDGSSPIAAGLILGEEGKNYSHPFSAEEVFPTEANQLLTAVMNLTWRHPSTGIFTTLGSRFDMGLPFDLTDSQGRGLTPEQSREELRRRGYSDDVIDLLSLEMEEPGSPDKSVAPHAIFDLSAGIDLHALLGVRARLGATVLNVLDTPYLYKFESSFGGTHFGRPRTFMLELEAGL